MIIIDNNTIFSIIKKNLNKEKVMERKTLKRQLGVLDVTAITAGIVIGAGVFVVTGIGAAYAIGAIPVLLVGLSTVYLNLMYPVEGGESYVYPTRIVSKLAGFLSGWGMWMALIGPIAITAKAFIAYVNALPVMSTQLNIIGFAVIVTVVFFIINWFGIKTVSIVQNILFIFMVVGILIYIIAGIPHMNAEYMRMGSPKGFSGVMKAASLLIFSYAGLTLAADLGEEAKNPAKTISWGVILGIIVPVILYTLSALVSTAIIPWDKFSNSEAPYATVASEYMGVFGVTFIIIVAWAAILSSHNGEQAVGARILFGLSRDKIIGGKLTKINKFGIPGYTLIATVIVAIFLIVSGTIQLVAEIIVAMFLYNWIITHIAVIMSRYKYSDMYEKMSKGFKGGFIVVPILGILVSGYLLILQGWKALAFAAIWMAIGAIVYLVRYNQNKVEINKLITEWPRDRYFE